MCYVFVYFKEIINKIYIFQKDFICIAKTVVPD